MNTFSLVRELVAAQTGVHVHAVTEQSKLCDDLGLDAFDKLDLSFEIEAAFGIDLTDADLETFRTVGDIVQFIDNYRVPGINGAAA